MVGLLALQVQHPFRLPLLGSPVTKRKRESRRTGAVTDGTARKREKRNVENSDFTKFCSRILRALGRRVAAGDIDALNDLRLLREELDRVTQGAVEGLRTPDHSGHAYSWEDIGRRLGISKQGAYKNWGVSKGSEGRSGPK